MKKIITELKTQLFELHKEVAFDVITFKNVFNLRAIVPLFGSFFLALKLSDYLIFTAVSFYLLDFITGTFATKVELRRNPVLLSERKERKGKQYWVESERIVRGIVKAVIYFQILLLSGLANLIMEKKEFQLHNSIMPLTLFQIFLILIITAEFVSNLENGKRAGFDLIGIISNGIKKFWNIKNLIKTGKE